MKINVKTFAYSILFIAGIFTSCKKDFLGQVPDDNLSIEDVFTRKVYTEQYLANVYSYIKNESDQNTDNTPWGGLSDELDVTYNDYPTYFMNTGNWDRNRGNFNFWGHYYRGIRNASYFLQNALPGAAEDLDVTLLTQYRAEARFLRAYFYFMLLRQYGPVIIMPEIPLPPDATIKDFTLPRNSYDECVDYIVSEIDASLPDLQNPNPENNSKDHARMNKGMALAVKSRVLLYAASPLFNGNTDYAEFKNLDGKQLINQQYDINKWKKAADAAKAVIDMPYYSLYKEFNADNTINVYASLKNVFLNSWNPEIIMAKNADMSAPDQNGAPRLGATPTSTGVGGWHSWGVTQKAVDAYFMANGQSPITGYGPNGTPIINPASGYNEIGFNGIDNRFYATGTFNMYVNREPRFYVAVTFDQSKWLNGSGGATVTNPMVISMLYGGNGGKYNGRNYSRTGYVVRKLVHPSTTQNNGAYVKRHEVKIRLAEIYLNYAEALNEYDPSNPDILKYLNMIRERAGIPQYGTGPSALPVPASKDEMRTAIWKERRVELAFENIRYFDTRRWKIAEQTDAGPFYGMDVDATSRPNFSKRTLFETRVFDKKFYLWNIVQSELNADKALVENPGW